MDINNSSFLVSIEGNVTQSSASISRKRKRVDQEGESQENREALEKAVKKINSVKLTPVASLFSQPQTSSLFPSVAPRNFESLELLGQAAAGQLEEERGGEEAEKPELPLDREDSLPSRPLTFFPAPQAPSNKTTFVLPSIYTFPPPSQVQPNPFVAPSRNLLPPVSEIFSLSSFPWESRTSPLPLSQAESSPVPPAPLESPPSSSQASLEQPVEKRRGWKKGSAWSLSEEAFLKIKNEHLLFILQEDASTRIGLSPSCLSKRWQFSQKQTAGEGEKILYPWPAKAKKEIEKLNNSLCLAIWHRIYRTRERVPTGNNLIALKKKLVDELETLALKSISTLVKEGSRVLEDSAICLQDPVNSISIANDSPLASERKEPKEIFTEEGIQRIASLWKLGKSQKEVARELGMAPCSLSKRWKKCLESSRYHHVKFQWKPGVQGSLKNLPISACSAIWHTVYGTEAQMTKEDASRLKKELMDELQTIFVEILRAGSKPL